MMTDEQVPTLAIAQKLKVLELFKNWGISDAEGCALLGNMDKQAYASFTQNNNDDLDDDLMHRLTMFILVDEWLTSLFNEPQRRYRWMRAPNDMFNGISAIELMMSGDFADIERVHDYLKAVVYG